MGIRSDGSIRSSDEVSVMEIEQRDVIIRLMTDNNYTSRRI